MSKCPHCKVDAEAFDIAAVPFVAANGRKLRGVSVSCQKCGVIIGVSFDMVYMLHSLQSRIDDVQDKLR